jgi:hypothetical protein
MLQFEKLVVDSCWLSLSNTVNLTTGGGTRPTDAMIAEAHAQVKCTQVLDGAPERPVDGKGSETVC